MRTWLIAISFTALPLAVNDSFCLAAEPDAPSASDNRGSSASVQGALTRPKSTVKHPDLDEAWRDYAAAVTDANTRVRAAISKQFDTAAADGDLDAAEKWQAALNTFDTTGKMPSEAGTNNAVSEAASELKKSKERLAESYEAVVKALTKEKKVAEAKAVRDESRNIGLGPQRGAERSPSTQRTDTPTSPSPPPPAATNNKDEHTMAHDEAAAECKKLIDRRRIDLAEQYTSAVWILRGEFQQSGELDKAIAADNEWKKSTRKKPLTSADVLDAPEELKELQEEYLAKWENVDAETATEFLEKLAQEASRLAKKGKLAEGRLLQQEIAKIKQQYIKDDKKQDGKKKPAGAPQATDDPVIACEQAIKEKRAALQAQYIGELEAMEKSFQAQGQLDEVFAARTERERFVNTPLLDEQNLVKAPDALNDLQQKYLKQQREVTESVANDFILRLEQKKQSLTIAGNLAEATQAKQDIQKLQARYTTPKVAAIKGDSLLSRDRLAITRGAWAFADNQLTYNDSGKDGMLKISAIAQGNFRLELDALPAAVAPSTLLCLYFRRGNRDFAIQLAQDGSCVMVDNVDPRAQGKARLEPVWQPGKLNRVSYEVDGDTLTVSVNGNAFLTHQGNEERDSATTDFSLGILGDWKISKLDLITLPRSNAN